MIYIFVFDKCLKNTFLKGLIKSGYCLNNSNILDLNFFLNCSLKPVEKSQALIGPGYQGKN